MIWLLFDGWPVSFVLWNFKMENQFFLCFFFIENAVFMYNYKGIGFVLWRTPKNNFPRDTSYVLRFFLHSMLYNHWTTSTLCLTQTIFDPRTLNISLHLHLEIRNTFLSGAVPCQKSKKLPYWLLDKNSHHFFLLCISQT